MNQINTFERLFRYNARANEEILAAMRLFDDASPAKEIAIRVLSHTYVVDRIFASNLTGAEHDRASANESCAPTLAELSGEMQKSDQWYIDYVSRLDNAQLAERIDFTFTGGEPGRMSREEMLLDVMIHGAAHRGQAGWIMMENSITPPADDRFTSYLHKEEASARRRPAVSSDTVEGHLTGSGPHTAPLSGQGPGEQRMKGTRCRASMS